MKEQSDSSSSTVWLHYNSEPFLVVGDEPNWQLFLLIRLNSSGDLVAILHIFQEFLYFSIQSYSWVCVASPYWQQITWCQWFWKNLYWSLCVGSPLWYSMLVMLQFMNSLLYLMLWSVLLALTYCWNSSSMGFDDDFSVGFFFPSSWFQG